MGQALDLLKDISHIMSGAQCVISINSDTYSTAIDIEAEIFDSFACCSAVISDFENFKKNKIAQSMAGKIDVSQMSYEVKEREKAANEALITSIFGEYRPSAYPFLKLREFLKPSGNGNMKICYLLVVLEANQQNQRSKFLKLLQEKCLQTFINCKVITSDKSYFIIRFN